LLSLWLANKVYDVVKDEEVAVRAMHLAEKELTRKKKKKGN
jgi:hypothetical protein